ncbi:hypothetical protein BOSE62_70218 [Bosea sp. 62]|nr:hypothetical protein BOSE7B_50048 [Bosea sp. 7B]CAD5300409.1 hypothetical protein BOSE21B_91451 [Bosea sp. 21B]VVT62113.1 hypothetical protein BOS5A_231381 [Bosea sp. EC-HK365B]VXC71295.1 hypothetical protein BOSE62_70218 [Bosea sp. 62]VXC96509.1 hypothetical protein BOSE127_90048 [Bosea sp. 127]
MLDRTWLAPRSEGGASSSERRQQYAGLRLALCAGQRGEIWSELLLVHGLRGNFMATGIRMSGKRVVVCGDHRSIGVDGGPY